MDEFMAGSKRKGKQVDEVLVSCQQDDDVDTDDEVMDCAYRNCMQDLLEVKHVFNMPLHIQRRHLNTFKHWGKFIIRADQRHN